VVFATAACSHYPADVEQALKLADDNRAELEKVLALRCNRDIGTFANI